MAVSDPVANMLTKIRNASVAGFENVDITVSKLKIEIVKVLKSEGFIKNYKLASTDGGEVIRIFLKYDESSKPVIHGIKKISKPGRRVYSGYKELPRIFNGYGILIVSTSGGVITGKKATDKRIGGELVCSVW